MAAKPSPRASSAIALKIAQLPTKELDALIIELRFNTRLEQSTLARALKEQRKRRRAAKAQAETAHG